MEIYVDHFGEHGLALSCFMLVSLAIINPLYKFAAINLFSTSISRDALEVGVTQLVSNHVSHTATYVQSLVMLCPSFHLCELMGLAPFGGVSKIS